MTSSDSPNELPGDIRMTAPDGSVWVYSEDGNKFTIVTQPVGEFDGGDVWKDDNDDDWIDPNPGRSLPWVL